MKAPILLLLTYLALFSYEQPRLIKEEVFYFHARYGYPKGDVRSRIETYITKNGKDTIRKYTSYFSKDVQVDRKKGYKSSEIIKVNGEFHGTQKYWNAKGNLISYRNYKMGILHGKQQLRRGGELIEKVTYNEGKRIGISEFYQCNYFRHRDYSSYDIEIGQLRSMGAVESNGPTGYWTYWHKSGKVKFRGIQKGTPPSCNCPIIKDCNQNPWGFNTGTWINTSKKSKRKRSNKPKVKKKCKPYVLHHCMPTSAPITGLDIGIRGNEYEEFYETGVKKSTKKNDTVTTWHPNGIKASIKAGKYTKKWNKFGKVTRLQHKDTSITIHYHDESQIQWYFETIQGIGNIKKYSANGILLKDEKTIYRDGKRSVNEIKRWDSNGDFLEKTLWIKDTKYFFNKNDRLILIQWYKNGKLLRSQSM